MYDCRRIGRVIAAITISWESLVLLVGVFRCYVLWEKHKMEEVWGMRWLCVHCPEEYPLFLNRKFAKQMKSSLLGLWNIFKIKEHGGHVDCNVTRMRWGKLYACLFALQNVAQAAQNSDGFIYTFVMYVTGELIWKESHLILTFWPLSPSWVDYSVWHSCMDVFRVSWSELLTWGIDCDGVEGTLNSLLNLGTL